MNDDGEREKKRAIEAKHILLIIWVIAAIVTVLWIAASNVPKGPATITVTTTVVPSPALNNTSPTHVYTAVDFLQAFTTTPIGIFIFVTCVSVIIYWVINGIGRRND